MGPDAIDSTRVLSNICFRSPDPNSGHLKQHSVNELEDGIGLKDLCPLAGILARRLREQSVPLTRRWLERIAARVQLDPKRVFPTDELLNNMPRLICGIADYVEDQGKTVLADTPVIAHALDLGSLRHAQGFDEYEVLKEYELFGSILFAFLVRTVEEEQHPCTPGELLACAHRLFIAVTLVQQTTLGNYMAHVREKLHEREDRLRGFNRTLSHELTNRINAITGAAQVLDMDTLGEPERRRLTGLISRNVLGMQSVLDNLRELSTMEADTRRARHVTLPRAVAEVARQLRDLARPRGVEIRIPHDLPSVEVNAAAVELCLSNLMANAIKYSDRDKPERWVEITAEQAPEDTPDRHRIIVRVSDNGVGVPVESRSRLFQRFFRAQDEKTAGVSGSGLGLSIVRETAEWFGGSAWAEFPDSGTVFAFSLPARRAADEEALRAVSATAST